MPTAFAVADPWAGPPVAIDQFLIYSDVHRLLSTLLHGAVVEFAQLQNALRAMADARSAEWFEIRGSGSRP